VNGPAAIGATLAAVAAACSASGVALARRSVPLRRATPAPGGRDVGVARRTPRALSRLGETGPGRRLARSAAPGLAAAGWAIPAPAFAGIRLAAGAAGLAIGAGAVVGSAMSPVGWALVPLFAVVGLRMPTILVGRAAARRRAAIDADVPQLLDLLAAASSAGLSAQLAVRRAAEAVRGPLAGELAATLSGVDLGARWRDELGGLVERTGSSDLRRAASVLSRTETLGASLEEATVELAASVRSARRAAVTERARTAPVKMLFPLVFLVLPAFLLLTVVPVLLTTLRSIR
jgi:tight adherence protein C